MTSDGTHTYTYDAEGNLTKVDGGTTAAYLYDALNHRVRATVGTAHTEFVFNQNGQRVSVWNASTNTVERDQYYWGSKPVAFAASGATHFQHQDWLGTERTRTTYNGSVEGTYASLPFGDGYTASGTDQDPYHYAQLDYDSETNSDHAQFRQYNPSQDAWMSPDPYSGSYVFTDPQSLNRYAYVSNNPLGYTDPSGLVLCDYGQGRYAVVVTKQYCINSGGKVVTDVTNVTVDGVDNSGSTLQVLIDDSLAKVIQYNTYGYDPSLALATAVANETKDARQLLNCTVDGVGSLIPGVNKLAGAPSYPGLPFGLLTGWALKGAGRQFPSIANWFESNIAPHVWTFGAANAVATTSQCLSGPSPKT